MKGGDGGTLTATALGIALSPLPLLLVLALLGTPRGVASTLAFVSGEALAIAGIASVAVFVLADGAGAKGTMVAILSVVELVIGVGLLLLLVLYLRTALSPLDRVRWDELTQRVGSRQAFVGGLAMVAVNPKNLALTLAGAATIVQRELSTAGQLVTLLAFTGIAISGLCVPLAIAAVFPARATMALHKTRSYIRAHERLLVGALLVALAVFFLGRGLVDVRA